MASCVIDGVQCRACCTATWIPLRPAVAREKVARLKPPGWTDLGFIRANWKPMSWRLAKKRNPYLATYLKTAKARRGGFYQCKRSTPAGCSVYADRPQVCSGFPRYNHPAVDWENSLATRLREYHPRCTEYIPAVVIP